MAPRHRNPNVDAPAAAKHMHSILCRENEELDQTKAAAAELFRVAQRSRRRLITLRGRASTRALAQLDQPARAHLPSWTQLGSDIDGEAAGDWSGNSVSMNSAGDRVAIGAHYNDGNGNRAGHVRVFEYQNQRWTQLETDIDGEEAGDWFGGADGWDYTDGHLIL